MKTLNKIEFNPEKIMKNDELVTIKGGYDACLCHCINGDNTYTIVSPDRDCGPLCYEVFGTTAGYCTN